MSCREKIRNTDTTENKAVSSEIVTSITISEQHDDSKEIKVLEQQPTSEVKPEATFTNDLGADSLDTVELIMELEKEFNITIPDDQAEKIVTVGDAISYVEANAK